MPLDTGRLINNRYRIVSLLGQGGYGAVYRAWDLNLKRPCAVKENLEFGLQSQRQFENEATILANLSHKHLPRVIDHFVLPEQGQYLVMDFVEGEDLEEMVAREGTIPIKQAVDWISQISDALDYLHSQPRPVIHRDVKPSNIRIAPDGLAYLVDFGLVKLFTAQDHTTPGARGVTPGFSPPEQYGHGGTNACSDIYSLGATLYNLLTGIVPPESVHRYAQAPLESVEMHNSKVPPSLSAVIDKAMSLDPDQRYQRVSDFKSAVRKSLAPYLDEDTLISQKQAPTIISPSRGVVVTPPEHSAPSVNRKIPSKVLPKESNRRMKRLYIAIAVAALLVICAGLIFVLDFLPLQFLQGEDATATDSVSSDVAVWVGKTLTAQAGEAELDSSQLTKVMIPSLTETPIPTLKPTSTPTIFHTPTMVHTEVPASEEPVFDLAFASDQDGEFSVYLMDTNTGEMTAVPRPPGYERAWWPSFCGSSIAVEAQDIITGDQWIYRIDIMTGQAVQIDAPFSPLKLGVPRCSPDGGYLAYSAKVGDVWGLFVTDFSTTYQFFPEDGAISGYASWSSNSTDFLFQVITEQDYENVIFRMTGHPSLGQYNEVITGANPALSPDGLRVVYSCQVVGNDRTLCLADSDGSNEVELVNVIRVNVPGIGWNIQPASAWSADGGWIYFASAVDGDWDIYRIRPDGSGLQNLTNDLGASNEVNPALKW